MFSGLLVCSDAATTCGIISIRKPGNPVFQLFQLQGQPGRLPTTHYIRVDFLEQVLLQEIRRLTKFASRYEDEFAQL